MSGTVLSTYMPIFTKSWSLPSENLVFCERDRHKSSNQTKNDKSYKGKAHEAGRGDIREDFLEKMTPKPRIKIGGRTFLKEERACVKSLRQAWPVFLNG